GPRARRPPGVRLRPRFPVGVRVKRIGIDVGGTNTDAVLLDGDTVVHAVKTPTTTDVTEGITSALRQLIEERPGFPGALPSVGGIGGPEARPPISTVMIGTTHFTNAVVQRRDLTRV